MLSHYYPKYSSAESSPGWYIASMFTPPFNSQPVNYAWKEAGFLKLCLDSWNYARNETGFLKLCLKGNWILETLLGFLKLCSKGSWILETIERKLVLIRTYWQLWIFCYLDIHQRLEFASKSSWFEGYLLIDIPQIGSILLEIELIW